MNLGHGNAAGKQEDMDNDCDIPPSFYKIGEVCVMFPYLKKMGF